MSTILELLDELNELIDLRDNRIDELNVIERESFELEKKSLDEDVKKMYRKSNMESFLEANNRLMGILKELDLKAREIENLVDSK